MFDQGLLIIEVKTKLINIIIHYDILYQIFLNNNIFIRQLNI